MHIKTVEPDSFRFDQPTSSLIKVSSRGLIGNDRAAFEKMASSHILSCMDDLIAASKPGDVLAHQIALGATEVTGPNRNGDGFTKNACKNYHHTFVKHGHCFRNHQNKCPAKSYGKPIKSAYNEEMGRVELISRYNGTKEAADRNGGLVADREIEKLASGRPLALSMAAMLPFDVCSYCNNNAPSVKEYCTAVHEGGHCKAGGLSDHIGSIVEVDGNVHHLHADNPEPRFFDISDVYRPADRTAYAFGMLQKRAGANQIIKSADVAAAWGIQVPPELLLSLPMTAGASPTLIKLAQAERSVESNGLLNTYASAFANGVTDANNLVLPDMSENLREANLLKIALAERNVLLPIATYFQIFGGVSHEKAASLAAIVQPQIPGIFNRLLTSGQSAMLSKFKSNGEHKKYAGLAATLSPHFAVDRSTINRRTTLAALQLIENPTVKTAGDSLFADDAVAQAAVDYASYKLAFVETVVDPFMCHMSVLQDYI